MKGVELELTVPDGCQPGELIYVDVPREGQNQSTKPALSAQRGITSKLPALPWVSIAGSSVVTSRPASANQKLLVTLWSVEYWRKGAAGGSKLDLVM